jgi:EAL domain-containing protein (putative c-di-GMP-specific phosphodiesterase class I)
VALDDVGTGFTGLPVLTMYAWDYLKLDRSLIARAARTRDDRELLGCLVAYARRTGTRIIAEGIEDDRQLAVCRQMGARWGQGFHLGAPVRVADPELRRTLDVRHAPVDQS